MTSCVAWRRYHRWDEVTGDPRRRQCRWCPATAHIDHQGRTIPDVSDVQDVATNERHLR
jgi:hypothetical protein